MGRDVLNLFTLTIVVEEQLPGLFVATTDDYCGPPDPIGHGASAREAVRDLADRLRDSDLKSDDESYGGTD